MHSNLATRERSSQRACQPIHWHHADVHFRTAEQMQQQVELSQSQTTQQARSTRSPLPFFASLHHLAALGTVWACCLSHRTTKAPPQGMLHSTAQLHIRCNPTAVGAEPDQAGSCCPRLLCKACLECHPVYVRALAAGTVFPLVFAIQQAFNRREQALKELALLKAQV